MTPVNARLHGYLIMAAMCVVVASRWLVEGAVPTAASTQASRDFGYIAAALLTTFWVYMRSNRGHVTHVPWPKLAVKSAALALALTGPTLAERIAGHRLGAGPASLALALTPAMIALGFAVTRTSADVDLAGAMWPGLTGLAGLVLLLPQPAFSHWRSWLGWIVTPGLIAAGVMLYTPRREAAEPETIEVSWAIPLALFAAAGELGFLSAAFHEGHSWSGLSTVLDAGTTLASVFALIALGPGVWSAQFLLIPLFGLLEGLILLRPTIDGRVLVGLGLVAIGGLRVLFRGKEPEEEGSAMRGRALR